MDDTTFSSSSIAAKPSKEGIVDGAIVRNWIIGVRAGGLGVRAGGVLNGFKVIFTEHKELTLKDNNIEGHELHIY
jgi:hypothetical protein